MSNVAFLFPGQGAQHVGMAKSICERLPEAKRLFERANEVLGFDLAKLCFEGPQEQLDKTDVSQPALYLSSFACLELVKAEKPELLERCGFAAGLSLGEYTALAFAGAMTFEDGLRVVRRRGQAMQAAANATPSGMVSALLLDDAKVNSVVEQAQAAGLRLWTANYLCPGNTVLSGDKAGCEAAQKLIEDAGGRPVVLAVAGAFHTEIMQSAVGSLTEVLESVALQAPKLPVISNVDAESHSDPTDIRGILAKQVVNPVLWEKCVRKLMASSVTEFYEIGPGKVLKGLMKRIDRKANCESINDTP